MHQPGIDYAAVVADRLAWQVGRGCGCLGDGVDNSSGSRRHCVKAVGFIWDHNHWGPQFNWLAAQFIAACDDCILLSAVDKLGNLVSQRKTCQVGPQSELSCNHLLLLSHISDRVNSNQSLRFAALAFRSAQLSD